MASQLVSEKSAEVLDWVTEQAAMRNIAITTYPGAVKQDGNWLHVPVTVNQPGDAYDRATWLQQIEDDWDSGEHGGLELLLVPAKSAGIRLGDRYAQAFETLERGRKELDRIVEDGKELDPSSVQRYLALRKDLDKTLDEIARKFPASGDAPGVA